MTEAVTSAIVPVVSTLERGQEIEEFLRRRMKYNHESQDKRTGARFYFENVSVGRSEPDECLMSVLFVMKHDKKYL